MNRSALGASTAWAGVRGTSALVHERLDARPALVRAGTLATGRSTRLVGLPGALGRGERVGQGEVGLAQAAREGAAADGPRGRGGALGREGEGGKGASWACAREWAGVRLGRLRRLGKQSLFSIFFLFILFFYSYFNLNIVFESNIFKWV
jgi:hypothetical protein